MSNRAAALIIPVVLFMAVLFCYPLLRIVYLSISSHGALTSMFYVAILREPIYLKVIAITCEIALCVTLLTLLLGYPVAYALTIASPGLHRVLLAMVLFPFVTDILVRTYAWMVILGPAGALNNVLGQFGIQPLHLLYNRAGVLIGMTYALLPYMVLTLYSVLRNVDERLVLAATSLGANSWQAFRSITIPLSLPGVFGGSLLVFVLSLGYFATPRLMGGGTDQTLALAIDQQIEQSLNWNVASALTVVLLVMTLIGFALYLRWIGLRSLLEQGHHQ